VKTQFKPFFHQKTTQPSRLHHWIGFSLVSEFEDGSNIQKADLRQASGRESVKQTSALRTEQFADLAWKASSAQMEQQAMSSRVMNTSSWRETNARATANLAVWSEENLVVAAKIGQRAAFGELCERHANTVFRVTLRITRNREDAEDATQDSFLNAFLHLKDFDGRSRFATWLIRIAINSALMKLRKRRGTREVPMDEPSPRVERGPDYEAPDSAPNPEETYRLHERKKRVSTAIDGLRPRIRTVVEFHQLKEYSLQETAQILGISTAAAKTRMFHARAALRQMLWLNI
jgi:RNA polymerase sigma-70 factor (ECF subfamily)